MSLPTRRTVLKGGTIAGAAMLVPAAALVNRGLAAAAAVSGGTLDPSSIPKYATPLFVVPAMPSAGTSQGVDVYRIEARQFTQQVLPAGFPKTTLFGFGAAGAPNTAHFPAYTIEARSARPVRVTWVNGLVDAAGHFLPHILTVDQTLHWANPPAGAAGRDMASTFTATPGPYAGPVPLVVHLHGAHVSQESDGYPQAWYLPAATDIPSGYATVGSYYDQYKAQAASRYGLSWASGEATYQYANDQRAAALWYHSHELGMTRVNVYAGLAGFYLLRGGTAEVAPGALPGPGPQRGDPPATVYHELPLLIADRSFNADGSLFFPTSRGFFGDTPVDGPWTPTFDIPPQWNPEFFGNTITVNGNTWPTVTVEPRRYRFRILNGSNARTLLLKISSDPLAARPATAALPLWVIGTDGGFLPGPVSLDTLRVAPAERFDVIVDFAGLAQGTELYLVNEGPDEPYGGGTVGVDFDPADPGTTGQVMRFVVGTSSGPDTSLPPAQLKLPAVSPLGSATRTRQVSLNELDSAYVADAPIVGLLGTLNADGTAHPLRWMDTVTENPVVNATEVWEIYNFTEDGHPVHLHLVQFQVVNRQPFDPTGTARAPEAWETGFKDTVVALPGEITRVKARFDMAGRYVWHCHILDHEDNEMMRPYQVG